MKNKSLKNNKKQCKEIIDYLNDLNFYNIVVIVV